MSYRFMRLMVFFDLPTETAAQRKEYTKFRKFLVRDGYVMLQYSVYAKIALNGTVAKIMQQRVRKKAPRLGVVQMLVVTERQYASIEYVVGESQSTRLESTDRTVVL